MSQMTFPLSTLIICSRNRVELLRDTVNSILVGHLVPAEMILVDQSDRPDIALSNMEEPRGCRVRYIHSYTVGVCRGRNEGIRAASHDLLAFTDDDMFVDPTWYACLIKSLAAAGRRAVITGRVLAAMDTGNGFVPALVPESEPARYRGRLNVDVLPSGNMAIFRSAFDEIGLFDERLGPGTRFPAAEDNDLGFRLLEAGYTIHHNPQALIYHRAWRSKDQYNVIQRAYGRGKGGFYMKYFSLKDPHIIRRLPQAVLLNLVRFPWRFLHRPDLATGDFYYTAGILAGMLDWLKYERKPADAALYPPVFQSSGKKRTA
jgi:GT2 family glycosyltransferase